jgi:hypothetical protein
VTPWESEWIELHPESDARGFSVFVNVQAHR